MIVSLAVLIKSADYFTTYSEKVGLILGISPFIVGATIVSVGTSLPELITSLISVFKDQPEIVAGNAVGSNITNILLVIGAGALLSKNALNNKRLDANLDIPILATITALLVLMLRDGAFTFIEAVIMVSSYVIYTAYLLHDHKKGKDVEKKVKEDTKDVKNKIHWYIPAIIVASGVGIYFGAEWTVESIIQISSKLNITTAVIAGTVVALGTSLPELVVSIQAARKKQAGMVLGNVFGSNIFNSTMVMGIPGLFAVLPAAEPVFSVGLPFLAVATFILLYSSLSRHISTFEGALYILFYVYFIHQFATFIL